MKFLKQLNHQALLEIDDMTELPEATIKELQKMVRTGAEQSGKWSNALDLANKAYTVLGISIPDATMKNAWKQYETIITYAVQQLGKFHGKKGTWRMTADDFVQKGSFDVTLVEGVSDQQVTTEIMMEADDIDEIVEFITEEVAPMNYEIKTIDLGSETMIEFWKHGVIKKKSSLTITKH